MYQFNLTITLLRIEVFSTSKPTAAKNRTLHAVTATLAGLEAQTQYIQGVSWQSEQSNLALLGI